MNAPSAPYSAMYFAPFGAGPVTRLADRPAAGTQIITQAAQSCGPTMAVARGMPVIAAPQAAPAAYVRAPVTTTVTSHKLPLLHQFFGLDCTFDGQCARQIDLFRLIDGCTSFKERNNHEQPCNVLKLLLLPSF